VADVRRIVQNADNECFVSSRQIYTISPVTADRLRHYNGVTAEVLRPPLANPGAFGSAATGDYIFAGGRINNFKRQLLAVEAMRHVRSSVRLVVAGAPETADDAAALEAARASCPKPERIVLLLRYISEEEKIELVNGALACVYCPIDEDYGLVALEGAQAGKALITTYDSGGTIEFVVDGRSGLVRQPDPNELAGAFDTLASSPKLAQSLGRGARARLDELGISWDHVLDRLLA
jgi:glycosyltransferase involved in cell wall biosynthesis